MDASRLLHYVRNNEDFVRNDKGLLSNAKDFFCNDEEWVHDDKGILKTGFFLLCRTGGPTITKLEFRMKF